MEVKRSKPIPDVKARFSGKEAKKLLNEIDKLTELVRFNPSIKMPTLDEFAEQLEEVVGEYC